MICKDIMIDGRSYSGLNGRQPSGNFTLGHLFLKELPVNPNAKLSDKILNKQWDIYHDTSQDSGWYHFCFSY